MRSQENVLVVRDEERYCVQFVYACLTCKKSKIEHQKSSGLKQPLDISEWKWDSISMDFMSGFPNNPRGSDAIWVIVDRLTKSAHFTPIKISFHYRSWLRSILV